MSDQPPDRDAIRVYINGHRLDLPVGTNAGQAVRLYDIGLAERMETGAAYLTDGRGIDISAGDALESGAILRVIVRARRGSDADA